MSEQKIIYENKPQINISFPSSARMWLVCGCAFLCILQSAFNDGGRSLITALTVLFTALLIELFLTYRNYGVKKVMDGSTAVTALVLTLLLPNQIHPLHAALGAVFAITVVKYSFGGLGSNWLNPAIGGWLFIRFSWPASFKNAFEGTSTSISELDITSGISATDNSAAEFLNNNIFSIANVQLPSGYIDLLFYNASGIIADRGLFFLLLGTIIITSSGINRGWIPLVYLAVYTFLVRFAGDLSGLYWNGDILYGIFSGGTVAAAFILAAEPASSVKLRSGILVTVILAAFLSWLFRYKFMDYTGCFTAMALVNCISPLIRLFEERFILSRNNRGKFQEHAL